MTGPGPLLEVGGRRWLCLWKALPPAAQRSAGEGFVLGVSVPGAGAELLDLSRLLLLNLALLLLAAAGVQATRAVERRLGDDISAGPWRAGFQERFLAGYLVLGLVLLVLVGASVDRVTHERIAGEAAARARAGLLQAVDQLRNVLTEQARTLAGSEYIAEMLEGQLTGARPAGPLDNQQGMVFKSDGTLLLDETLGNLEPAEAAGLLAAARRAPLVVQKDGEDLYVGTVIPLDLGGILDTGAQPAPRDQDAGGTGGFFFYRQRLDSWLVYSLADLVQGQITLRFDGRPMLASHPGSVFAGRIPPLAEPDLLVPMLDHPSAPGVLAAAGRPFALTGCQPLPAFVEPAGGGLQPRAVPALLTVTFPDREREYADQRRTTALFLAGLANLILLTALLLAVLMSWNIFRPVRLLMAASRSLAAGDYDAPLPEAGRDEVGRLADSFGRMRGELRSALDRLAARERFLATVLDRVTVGVAVIDADGRVAVLNPAGRQIVAGFHPDVSAEQAAVRLREQLQDGDPDRDRDHAAGQLRSADGRRTLRGAVAPLELPGGRRDTMLVFEDITGFLEAQKLAINAELARQVAHEIKNPADARSSSRCSCCAKAWQDRASASGPHREETVAAGAGPGGTAAQHRRRVQPAGPARRPGAPRRWTWRSGGRPGGRLRRRPDGGGAGPRWRSIRRRAAGAGGRGLAAQDPGQSHAELPGRRAPGRPAHRRGVGWRVAPAPRHPGLGRRRRRASPTMWPIVCSTRIFPPRARARGWGWPSAGTWPTAWGAASPWPTATTAPGPWPN